MLQEFQSTVPVDVLHVDSFLDPTCVPVRISINKLDVVPNRIIGDFTDLGTRSSTRATSQF